MADGSLAQPAVLLPFFAIVGVHVAAEALQHLRARIELEEDAAPRAEIAPEGADGDFRQLRRRQVAGQRRR